MTFDLSEDDYELLLLALGIAAGYASKDNPPLAVALIRLANTINNNNPNWTMYKIPDTQ